MVIIKYSKYNNISIAEDSIKLDEVDIATLVNKEHRMFHLLDYWNPDNILVTLIEYARYQYNRNLNQNKIYWNICSNFDKNVYTRFLYKIKRKCVEHLLLIKYGNFQKIYDDMWKMSVVLEPK